MDGMRDKKFACRNSIAEKRRMRADRKKRKRILRSQHRKQHVQLQAQLQRVIDLKSSLDKEVSLREKSQNRMQMYKNMARTYWERWRWESQKRKEAMIQNHLVQCSTSTSKHPSTTEKVVLQHIDPSMLTNAYDNDNFVGRGSFGRVKVQLYHGTPVAVKQFLPRTVVKDVVNEVEILLQLSHPNLPYFFGVCVTKKPHLFVTQFEGIQGDVVGSGKAWTVHQELLKRDLCGLDWILVCAQITEAVRYLHFDVGILHNDIKPDNILLKPHKPNIPAVLIDFGKATKLSNAKLYTLSELDQADYMSRPENLYLAPEVLSGESRQSRYSDMFAMGGVFYKILDAKRLTNYPDHGKKLCQFTERCRCIHYSQRQMPSKHLNSLRNY